MTRYLIASIVVVVFLLCAQSVQAQTTCPAGVTSAKVTSGAQFSILWCSPATDNVTGANAYGLSATPVAVQGVQQIAGPFSDGLVQMRGTLAVPKGHYTMTLSAVNASGEGAVSAPFTLDAVDPAPQPPVRLRVQ